MKYEMKYDMRLTENERNELNEGTNKTKQMKRNEAKRNEAKLRNEAK
jgi:hypothetical protein